MTYEEAVELVAAMFAASEVDVTVWGRGDDGALVASLSGTLRHVVLNEAAEEQIQVALGDAAGEAAAIFSVSDAQYSHVSIWPSRFISCRVQESPKQVEIVQRDAVVRISQMSRPWID